MMPPTSCPNLKPPSTATRLPPHPGGAGRGRTKSSRRTPMRTGTPGRRGDLTPIPMWNSTAG
uniref:Uncharacterized protein n=1 Tax=Arundo donax TaxID=35708 RepID=A0A0A9GAS0_ARUDO